MLRFLTSRIFHFIILLGLLSAALWFGGSYYNARKDIRYVSFDMLNQTYPREVLDENRVVIIDIDDESLNALGQWPWSRTTYINIVKNLSDAGVKAIAFDGVLAEPDRSSPKRVLEMLQSSQPGERYLDDDPVIQTLKGMPDNDALFAQAIKESKVFVTGFTFSTYAGQPRRPRVIKRLLIKSDGRKDFLEHATSFKTAAVFLPELEKAAAGNGSFMAYPDHDGVMRRTSMVFSDGKQLYPSLSLEALRVGLLGRKDSVKIGETPLNERKEIDTDYRIVLGQKVIPVDNDGLIWLHYRHFDRKRDYISAASFAGDSVSEEARKKVDGRIVLIGASAEGLKDLRNSSIAAFIPGVEIHANAVEQVLGNDYLMRPEISHIIEEGSILIVGLLVIALAPLINVLAMAVICGTLIAFIVGGSFYAYTELGLLIDFLYPVLSVFCIFVLSVMLTYIRTEADRRQVRDAFGLYISPDFMKELTDNPDKLTLGGEIRDLSVMFSDIRSFTTISEGLTPTELIQLMNDFLTPMSDLVMQNRGTIDKYMGDAMMAFWNAPLDDEKHAYHACRTALQMNDALVPINEEVREKAIARGVEPVLLNAGIGINTGPCAVGNMGSRQRFAYSTLGDAVNLASRLEGQTKNYGVNILIGHETWKQVPNFATLEFDLIQVKGKTEPVRVFALLGDETMASSNDFIALKEKHDAMLAAYRAQDFDEAIALCQKNRTAMKGYLEAFYDVYAERSKNLKIRPPGKGWDGVFIATSK